MASNIQRSILNTRARKHLAQRTDTLCFFFSATIVAKSSALCAMGLERIHTIRILLASCIQINYTYRVEKKQ